MGLARGEQDLLTVNENEQSCSPSRTAPTAKQQSPSSMNSVPSSVLSSWTKSVRRLALPCPSRLAHVPTGAEESSIANMGR